MENIFFKFVTNDSERNEFQLHSTHTTENTKKSVVTDKTTSENLIVFG